MGIGQSGFAPSEELKRFLAAREFLFRCREDPELPKSISGKIRRVQLRGLEQEPRPPGFRRVNEYWEEDFPELKENR